MSRRLNPPPILDQLDDGELDHLIAAQGKGGRYSRLRAYRNKLRRQSEDAHVWKNLVDGRVFVGPHPRPG